MIKRDYLLKFLRPSVKLLIIHSSQAAGLQGHLTDICVPGLFPSSQPVVSESRAVSRYVTSRAESGGAVWWRFRGTGGGTRRRTALWMRRSASDGRLEELSDTSSVVSRVVSLSCSSRERAHPRTKTRRQDSCSSPSP